jgi:sugar lactone lactonase YvrE
MSVHVVKGDYVRCVLPWEATVGESPVWHVAEQNLYWVDIQRKQVHRFHPASGENQTFCLPEIVTCIALRSTGGLALTLRKHFAFFNPATAKLEKLAEVESNLPDNRFNDGKCDPQGRFWAGTMDTVDWSAPTGNLFRMDRDGAIRLMQTDVICSNGSGWSPDGSRM